MNLKKLAVWILVGLGLVVVLFLVGVWAITFHPAPVQAETVICSEPAPTLEPGQLLKVMTYNVQYMAGKNYVFFYDLPDNSGPDERPSAADITITIGELARIIRDEDPDVVLLQEVDEGAKRTDYEDQLARLLPLLPPEYVCHSSAFYWKAGFVPHPRIKGAVGMKLSTISKYQIDEATRHQLALIPSDPLTQQFNLKRAVLETRLPVAGGQDLAVLNTHLEAFAQGTDTMQKQVAQVDKMLDDLTQAGNPWLIGGDFNLLPPGQAYERLRDDKKVYYQPETELEVLYDQYQVVPSLADVNGPDYQQWFTSFPNDPTITSPDKTIDYIFFADNMALIDSYVRQHDTLDISDHLPVIAEFRLP